VFGVIWFDNIEIFQLYFCDELTLEDQQALANKKTCFAEADRPKFYAC